jgi:hypothetical protein
MGDSWDLIEVTLCQELGEFSKIEGHYDGRLVGSAGHKPMIVLLVESIGIWDSERTSLVVMPHCCLTLLTRAHQEVSTAVRGHTVPLEVAR